MVIATKWRYSPRVHWNRYGLLNRSSALCRVQMSSIIAAVFCLARCAHSCVRTCRTSHSSLHSVESRTTWTSHEHPPSKLGTPTYLFDLYSTSIRPRSIRYSTMKNEDKMIGVSNYNIRRSRHSFFRFFASPILDNNKTWLWHVRYELRIRLHQ